jgi:hypothetical protein
MVVHLIELTPLTKLQSCHLGIVQPASGQLRRLDLTLDA